MNEWNDNIVLSIIVSQYFHKRHHEYKMADIEKAIRKASEGVVDPIAQRNIFSTNPTTEGTNYARNFFCEAICTFVFISAILAAASRAGENVLLLAICVGLIVWAVGMGMGGITGFAMNQARDLGPRMAYQVLPIKNKADNNWKYGLLVPGIAPFVGAALAALFVHGFLGMF